MRRPVGVTIIAILFLLNATCLCSLGIIMLISPEVLRGLRWLRGAEMGGPYVALFVGVVWGLIGWGLIRMRGWARLAAMLWIAPGMAFGIVALTTASRFHWSLLPLGLEILAGMVMVWYLFTAPIIEQFSKTTKTT
ncbi:MAG: hypothetical protein WA637_16840 [Terriglobales bacterium]